MRGGSYRCCFRYITLLPACLPCCCLPALLLLPDYCNFGDLALADSGTVFSMGLNVDGQLGHSGHAQSVPVGSPHDVLMLTCIFSAASLVWSPWHYGQALNQHSHMWHALQVPQEVFVPEPVIQVAAGHHHTLFLTQSGDIWACGRNSRGQLGLGSKAGSYISIPQPLSALAGFDHFVSLCLHTCIV